MSYLFFDTLLTKGRPKPFIQSLLWDSSLPIDDTPLLVAPVISSLVSSRFLSVRRPPAIFSLSANEYLSATDFIFMRQQPADNRASVSESQQFSIASHISLSFWKSKKKDFMLRNIYNSIPSHVPYPMYSWCLIKVPLKPFLLLVIKNFSILGKFFLKRLFRAADRRKFKSGRILLRARAYFFIYL